MGNFDGIWEHELEWLAFLQKENADGNCDDSCFEEGVQDEVFE